MTKDPKDQFQLGDVVIYMPEGIAGHITGFVWSTSLNAPAKIELYQLSVGCNAKREELRLYAGELESRDKKARSH